MKNICMDLSSNKLAKSHSRRQKYSYKKTVLREKLNQFK